MRLAGHKLSVEWSGEYGVESSSTGTCLCGWRESGSSQKVVRFEYRRHLLMEQAKLESARTGEGVWDVLRRLEGRPPRPSCAIL